MAKTLRSFLEIIDSYLADLPGSDEAPLVIYGRSAVILGYGLDEGATRGATKDLDVIDECLPPGRKDLLEKFGRGSRSANAAGYYLESMPSSFSLVPAAFRERLVAIEGTWRVLRPSVLERHDLVISKLKRFAPHDRADIQFLAETRGLEIDKLKAACDEAFTWVSPDDDSRDIILSLSSSIGSSTGRRSSSRGMGSRSPGSCRLRPRRPGPTCGKRSRRCSPFATSTARSSRA